MADRAATDLTLRSRVPQSAVGVTVLDYLSARFRYHDRARWQQEIEAGRIRIDERVAAADDRLPTGGWLVYRKAHVEPPVDANFAVVSEDVHVLAIDKPAHLPMHADGPFVQHTLVSLLRRRLALPGLQLVHRLDRETSGIVLIAKTDLARTALLAQFAVNRVRKVYHAVVRGHVDAEVLVDEPIGRSSASAIALRRAAGAAAADARRARTHIRPVAHGPAATLVECIPATGRTHQIRVHLETIGHPVLGDKLYGRPDADYLQFVARVKAGGDARAVQSGEPDRQLLHASELEFDHPETSAPCRVAAPLPASFRRWLADVDGREPRA